MTNLGEPMSAGGLSFSVVIPTCDRPTLLDQAVASVLDQSRPAADIVVVDNGTVGHPDPAALESRGIRYVRALQRFGVSQARNVGAILASGDFVAFLDDDDKWHPAYLEEVNRHIAATGARVVIGRPVTMQDGRNLSAGRSDPLPSRENLRAILLRRNLGITGSTTVVERKLLMATAGYDPLLVTGQDKGLILDIMARFDVAPVRAMNAIAYVRKDNSESRERQMEVRKRLRGTWRFLLKYRSELSLRDALFLLRIILKLRWQAFFR